MSDGAPTGGDGGAGEGGGGAGEGEARRRRRRRRPGEDRGGEASGDRAAAPASGPASGGDRAPGGGPAGGERAAGGGPAGGERAAGGGPAGGTPRRDERGGRGPQREGGGRGPQREGGGRGPQREGGGRGPQRGSGGSGPQREGGGSGPQREGGRGPQQPRGDRGPQQPREGGANEPQGDPASAGPQQAGDGGPQQARDGGRGPQRDGGRGPQRDGGRGPQRDAGGRGPQRDGGGRGPQRDGGGRGPQRDGGGRGPQAGAAREGRGPQRDDRDPRAPRVEGEARDPRAAREGAPSTVDTDWDEDGPAPAESPVAAAGGIDDDDGPAPAITLGADLPLEPDADDPDPTSADLVEVPVAALGETIAAVLGVRLQPTGKIFWCDAGTADYKVGDLVVVDSERQTRIATVAVAPARKPVSERLGRMVLRKAHDGDRAQQAKEHDRALEVLRLAKDKIRDLRLPAKAFRVEYTQAPGANGKGGRLNLYFTSEDRIELRELMRDLGNATGARIELRQVGVRDEAKHVGGIGSCGQELCCTTWLPDFVPVSIKMAKDQGLVLNPTKVSGQCGRLKCCLVYEQATYAEMRKGLPKLGKRVITATGEGRVVEVDVLRQRVRVAFGPGESQVMPASEVKPMFPAQQPGGRGAQAETEPESESETETETESESETETETETDTESETETGSDS